MLNKEGPLSADEYAHIMTHPVLGWRILRPLMADAEVALHIVRSHHERYDGRGVPDMLAASHIPLEARICAVADSFDAMMSVRPYRKTMSIADAVAELHKHAGSQFDPRIVQAFLAALERGEIEACMQQPIGVSPAVEWALR